MTSDRYRNTHNADDMFVRGYRCAAAALLNGPDRPAEYATLCRLYNFQGTATVPDETEFGQGVQAALTDWSEMFQNLYVALDQAIRQ
jgi:hypothetical protein